MKALQEEMTEFYTRASRILHERGCYADGVEAIWETMDRFAPEQHVCHVRRGSVPDLSLLKWSNTRRIAWGAPTRHGFWSARDIDSSSSSSSPSSSPSSSNSSAATPAPSLLLAEAQHFAVAEGHKNPPGRVHGHSPPHGFIRQGLVPQFCVVRERPCCQGP